jgi:hypothetical protein
MWLLKQRKFAVKLRIFYLAACQNRRLIEIFDTVSVKNPLFQQPARKTLMEKGGSKK